MTANKDMIFAKLIRELQTMTDAEIEANMATTGLALANMVVRNVDEETIRDTANVVLVCGEVLKTRKVARQGA